jgi:hypothetical protein
MIRKLSEAKPSAAWAYGLGVAMEKSWNRRYNARIPIHPEWAARIALALLNWDPLSRRKEIIERCEMGLEMCRHVASEDEAIHRLPFLTIWAECLAASDMPTPAMADKLRDLDNDIFTLQRHWYAGAPALAEWLERWADSADTPVELVTRYAHAVRVAGPRNHCWAKVVGVAEAAGADTTPYLQSLLSKPMPDQSVILLNAATRYKNALGGAGDTSDVDRIVWRSAYHVLRRALKSNGPMTRLLQQWQI